MDIAAFHHRPDSEDCYLNSDGQVTVHFQTAIGDVAGVTLLYGDPYLTTVDPATQGLVWEYQAQAMTVIGTGQRTDYWGTEVQVPDARLQYQFLIEDLAGRRVLYTDRGVRPDTAANRTQNAFRLPYLHLNGFGKAPAWARETVWYQIFPERFANGDRANDPTGTKPWQPTDHPGRTDFYGGDLQGVLNHLNDLQALGVNGLYFCPIFQAPSNHKYDTTDYFSVDPAFGDAALLTELIQEAHSRGMRIMLDGVFNHLGASSPQWQDVVQKGARSAYANWFHIREFPVTPYHAPQLGEGRPQYETFAYEPTLPKLNTQNPAVQAYLIQVAAYWIKSFDIDAWRLDAAGEVDHQFWRRLASTVHGLKPDVLLIGEFWHSAQSWLVGDQFTGVMNYPYTEQILAHFVRHELSAKELAGQLTDQLMLYRAETNVAMLNSLDSHDTPRLLTLAHGDTQLALQTLAFMFCQPGMPCLYYGTEMGMTGETDPDCRKPMDWAQLGTPIWQEVQAIVAFRRAHAALLSGGGTQLAVTADGLIQVTRSGRQQLVGTFNTTDHSVPFAAFGELSQGQRNGVLAPRGFVLAVAGVAPGR